MIVVGSLAELADRVGDDLGSSDWKTIDQPMIDYGLSKVRFPAPVPAGSRVRLRMTVASAEAQAAGTLLCRGYTMELEGSQKPAMVAEMMTLIVAA
ncbi:hypothetical protein ABXN37_23720 [Piscinibacter sakaiensis]|uniref:Nodulation protein N n=1 Tax=Piscinibacter sakaiensis TaxID=1547922 RepID=A0A0K8P606_PISS1|nr:nodulation protein N [Piscinibacter sakaiensis]